MSVGASAVTQLSSCTASIASEAETRETGAEGSAFVGSRSGALRLRDFFSPLKDRGLTMLYACI